jgi:hypothetical protein
MPLIGSITIPAIETADILVYNGLIWKFRTQGGREEDLYRKHIRDAFTRAHFIRKITFQSGPKYSTKSVRVYAHCFHGQKLNLAIKTEDFIEGQNLEFFFELDCKSCGEFQTKKFLFKSFKIFFQIFKFCNILVYCD